MKKIDYEKIQKDSIRYGVSVYTLVKRELNYKIVNKSMLKTLSKNRCCFLCKNKIKVCYDYSKPKIDTRIQCEKIGASKDKSADIEDNYICDAYEEF